MLLWLSHPDDYLLYRYVFGHVNEERVIARIEEHLERCEQCRSEVELVRSTGRALDELARAPQCGPAKRVR